MNLKLNDLKSCDDGNNFNEDGCNSDCFIEPNYGCANNINGTSICSPLADFTLKYLYT